MNIRYAVEYSVMFQNKDGNVTGAIWDVTTELDEDMAAEYVLKLAEKQAKDLDLEVMGMARAQKKINSDEASGGSETVYLTPFEQVDIYAREIHPPKRFRDIANAE